MRKKLGRIADSIRRRGAERHARRVKYRAGIDEKDLVTITITTKDGNALELGDCRFRLDLAAPFTRKEFWPDEAQFVRTVSFPTLTATVFGPVTAK